MVSWWLSSFIFFKQKNAYEMRISDWSSDVCSSDLTQHGVFFFGFVTRTAYQLAIFIRLEVGQANNNGLGIESGGQGADAFCKFFDEEGARADRKSVV